MGAAAARKKLPAAWHSVQLFAAKCGSREVLSPQKLCFAAAAAPRCTSSKALGIFYVRCSVLDDSMTR